MPTPTKLILLCEEMLKCNYYGRSNQEILEAVLREFKEYYEEKFEKQHENITAEIIWFKIIDKKLNFNIKNVILALYRVENGHPDFYLQEIIQLTFRSKIGIENMFSFDPHEIISIPTVEEINTGKVDSSLLRDIFFHNLLPCEEMEKINPKILSSSLQTFIHMSYLNYETFQLMCFRLPSKNNQINPQNQAIIVLKELLNSELYLKIIEYKPSAQQILKIINTLQAIEISNEEIFEIIIGAPWEKYSFEEVFEIYETLGNLNLVLIKAKEITMKNC